MTTDTLRILTPEIVLTAAAVAIYLGGAFSAARRGWNWIAATAMVVAAVALAMQPTSAGSAGPLTLDSLAWQGRWFALGFGGLLLMVAFRPFTTEGTPEYVGSLLLTIAGLMLVAAAGDLVLLFVSLELISIPTYVLLYLGRSGAQCQESTAKYFFLSVLSSAILLYGFSFLYGVAGSTDLTAVAAALGATAQLPTGFATFLNVAMGLVFAGLCFKITAVPFQFYAPDVYQGNSYPNAALLSVVPKAAGLLVMIRLLVMAMPSTAPYSWWAVAIVSLLSMTLGNVLGLWQDDLRRLLAYSTMAQGGYMLIGLAVALASHNAPGGWNGVAALAFYLVAYAGTTVGAMAVFERLGRPDRSLDGVEELAGLGRTRPLAAALMAIFMFSLTGVPPLAGFWGKFLVFGSALNVGSAASVGSRLQLWFTLLAVAGVINAAVAAAYYLRVVAVMYFRTPLATPRAEGGRAAWWAAVACAVLVVGIGLYPGPLARWANQRQETRPPPQSAPRSGVAACSTGMPGGLHSIREHW